ncbi:MAG: hypothetical protein A3J70_05645 [Elusimicrobia bacterium RIFCSPHIGHO2_02_FULL_61_10]|nr:MAG: hypothetical protein A3J70_05645 [Elusimicrobia bacterium RIFCSPHIGHO2_02_FULL_61_10]
MERWFTSFSRPLSLMERASSSVPKVPLPAAHQTFIPLVSSTSSQALIPFRFVRRASKLSL